MGVGTYLSKEGYERSELLELLGGLEEEYLELGDEMPLLLQELLAVSDRVAFDVGLQL